MLLICKTLPLVSYRYKYMYKLSYWGNQQERIENTCDIEHIFMYIRLYLVFAYLFKDIPLILAHSIIYAPLKKNVLCTFVKNVYNEWISGYSHAYSLHVIGDILLLKQTSLECFCLIIFIGIKGVVLILVTWSCLNKEKFYY